MENRLYKEAEREQKEIGKYKFGTLFYESADDLDELKFDDYTVIEELWGRANIF